MSDSNGKGEPIKKSPYVVWIYADTEKEWNCSAWRCLTPSDAFNKHNDKGFFGKLIHSSGFISNFLDPAVQDWIAPADVIVFQRNIISEAAFNAMEYWMGLGKPVVVDLDDAYQSLPYANPAKNFWHFREEGKALRMLEHGIKISNGLLAPNKLLLLDYHKMTGCNTYYLPNLAEKGWWMNLKSRTKQKKMFGLQDNIVIGWGGSVSHYDSWWGTGIREAASKVCRRHPEVVWMICGNDSRIRDQLPVPKNQTFVQDGVPPEDWPQIVKTFDIGVAPMYGFYDQRRSWIKGIEYLLAGVPWIGTQGEAYNALSELGTLIPNGEDHWEESLEHMITNLKDEQRKARSLINHAQKTFIAEHRMDIYQDVFTRIKGDFEDGRTRLPGVIKTTGKQPETDRKVGQPVTNG